MTDTKKIEDGKIPKVTLTDEQWDFLKRSENERTRDQIRHNAEVRELLKSFTGFLPKPDTEADKRDWFAGQALAGICSFHGTYGEGNDPVSNADRAYEQADAMLAARKAGEA